MRFNGRVYEALAARRERRPRRDLYHAALELVLPEGRFTVENAWPSPNADTASRGVVFEGPVFDRRLARFRAFRYEVRCWRDGTIPDVAEAVGGPQPVSKDEAAARRLFALVGSVPVMTWGRDELGAGEMWNSNSVISWLLVSSGVPVQSIRPPAGGRVPGWKAGLVATGNGPPE